MAIDVEANLDFPGQPLPARFLGVLRHDRLQGFAVCRIIGEMHDVGVFVVASRGERQQ